MGKTRNLFFCAFLLLEAVSGSAAEKRNIIFLDICSARADHFGAYGYGRDTTPNIDSFGKRAAVFENALSEGSWCLPSYASLMTGHVPEVHGLYTNLPARQLPPFESTLAQELRGAGYKTALFSGGVYLLPEWGLTRGFDHYANIFSTASPERIPAPFEDNLQSVLGWVKENRGSPFFLFATIDDLHVPYHSPDPEKYDPGYGGVVHDTGVLSVPFARAYNGEEAGVPARMREKAVEFKSGERHLKHLAAHYDAALNAVDGRIGDFLKKMKELGLFENTILIISADHGEMLGEKGLINHTQGLYEPVLRVPLIVRAPDITASFGARIKPLVQRIDLMPTILDMAGVSGYGLGLQGRSFVPLLKDPAAPWREYAFARSRRNLTSYDSAPLIDERVARDACWKLHHYLYKAKMELYDLCSDPLETRDLYGSRPEIAGRLSYELIRNMEETRPHQPGPPPGAGGVSLEMRNAGKD